MPGALSAVVRARLPQRALTRAANCRTAIVCARQRHSRTCRVLEVNHLPKADLLGKCDPFVKITAGGKTDQTEPHKKTYRTSFTKKFMWDDADSVSEMVVDVYDGYNTLGDKFIGTCTVPNEFLRGLKQDGGKQTTHKAKQWGPEPIKDKKGNQVKGYDEETCVVTMLISMGDLSESDAKLEELQKAMQGMECGSLIETNDGNRIRLSIKVVKVEHLPRLDSFLMGGKCDPYIVVESEGQHTRDHNQRFSTQVKKNCFNADFNEEFKFHQITRDMAIRFDLMDYDSMPGRDDDLIGQSVVEHKEVEKILEQAIKPQGFNQSKKLELEVWTKRADRVTGGGDKVVGYSKNVTTLTVELTPYVQTKQQAQPARQKCPICLEIEAEKENVERELKQTKQNCEQKKSQLRQEISVTKRDLEETRGQLDFSNEIKKAVQSLLPSGNPDGVGGMTAQGYRTDLEIECVGKAHSGDETQSIFAHLNIMHARLPGIQTHLEEAYKLKGQSAHVLNCDTSNSEEMDALFDFLKDFHLDGEPASTEDPTKKQMDTGNDSIKGFSEHNWDPAHCISVPGTVFGIGFRCTCAHGAFQKQIEGNPEKTSEEVTDEVGSGSFTTLLRIVGVSPKVVRKVVEVMYGYSREFESLEVRDAILLARFFRFKDLLITLYKEGHFHDPQSSWGCSLWDAARVIDEELGKRWLPEILNNADFHFEKDRFQHDGANLSEEGLLILLSHADGRSPSGDDLNCSEKIVYEAMMTWSEARYDKAELRSGEELAAIENLRKDLAESADPEMKEKLDTLNAKKQALEKRKPSFHSIASPCAKKVRYPFIDPEYLNHEVARNKRFQQIAPVDDNGVPLVLRAVFHQDGQRMPGWDTELHWTPRQGSTIYSGEWEWKYGPAAMTPSDDGVYEWPVQPKYFQTDFPFATEAEVEALSLLKLEIVNLDKDGDGDPNIDDILLTFRFCYPERRGGAASGEISFDDSFLTYLQTRSEAAIARNPSKLPLNAEEKFLVAKKIAKGTREIRGDPQSSGPIQRKIFAVGRVRPSKINSDKNKRHPHLRDRSDQRLYGHAFVIFEELKQARDVKRRFSGAPFFVLSPASGDIGMQWKALDGERDALEFDIGGPQGTLVDEKGQSDELTLQLTVVRCLNMPDTSGCRVILRHDGHESSTETVDGSRNFEFPVLSHTFDMRSVKTPGTVNVSVVDQNEKLVGISILTENLITKILQDEKTDTIRLPLMSPADKSALMGSNGEQAILQLDSTAP